MQIRTADRAACDLHDGVAGVLNLRICNGVAANIFLAVPNESSHFHLSISGGLERWDRQRALLHYANTRDAAPAPAFLMPVQGDNLAGWKSFKRAAAHAAC